MKTNFFSAIAMTCLIGLGLQVHAQWTRVAPYVYPTTITDNVGIGTTAPLSPLSFGTGSNNTKIALYENGATKFGLGYQPAQFRLHLDASSSRYSFFNAPAGTEILTILGDGSVGIGITNPQTNLVVFDANNPSLNLQYNTTSSLQLGLNTSNGFYAPIATVGDATICNRAATGTGDLIFVNTIASPSTGNGAIRFVTSSSGIAGESEKMTIQNNGQVLIGTPCTSLPAGGLLGVNGTIYAKAIKVELPVSNCFPDYVFEKDYNLLSLEELEKYVNKNKHLPEVPSANEVEKNGINVVEMDAILLKKIEELTLYMIEMKKENTILKNKIEAIKNK